MYIPKISDIIGLTIQNYPSVNLWQLVKLLHFNYQTVPIYRQFQIVQKRLQKNIVLPVK
jgi:hypothetical protein